MRKYTPKDFIGKKFGKLTIVEEIPKLVKHRDMVRVLCECGNTKICCIWYIVSGKTKSCGCLAKSNHAKKHSLSNSPEYRSWQSIKARCGNKNNPNFCRYGGKGLKMFDGWVNDFKKFYDHIGPCPSADHSVDRIDNTKGYFPGNVRWATRLEQNNNRGDNRLITFNNKTQSLTLWAREVGINIHTLGTRIKLGWDAEEALTAPVNKKLSTRRRFLSCQQSQ
jgi:hypothetical protein